MTEPAPGAVAAASAVELTPAAAADELDTHKLAAARLWATTRMPYLAAPIFATAIVAAPQSGKFSIDLEWQIHADPGIVEELSVVGLGRLIVHLTGHVIRNHADRAIAHGVPHDGRRAHWNRCADAEINDDLQSDDLVPEVAPDLPDALGCEPGRLAEAYYADATDGPRHWDCGSGADGHPRPEDGGGFGLNRPQRQLLAMQAAAEIQQAEARDPGTVPGGWVQWAESVLPNRTDWRRMLAAEVRRAVSAVAGKVDYSYRRPSRRADCTPDLVLPTLHRPVPEVAIVCDTSGSMNDALLGRALAEVEAVLTRTGLRGRAVRVLAVDAAVQTVQRVSRAHQVELAGGGGTDMEAGLDAALALRPAPSVVVVLTDGFTPWPAHGPRGVTVVVGLLKQEREHGIWAAPEWARVVEIEESV